MNKKMFINNMNKKKISDMFDNPIYWNDYKPIKKTIQSLKRHDLCSCGGIIKLDSYYNCCSNCGLIIMILDKTQEYTEYNTMPTVYKKDEHFIKLLQHCDVKNKDKYITQFNLLKNIYVKYAGNRKNFLNYNYILFKLLEIDNIYNDKIKMLKRIESLKEHDIIWKKMTKEIGLTYISSI